MNGVGPAASHEVSGHRGSSNKAATAFNQTQVMPERRTMEDEEDDSSLESETYPPGYEEEQEVASPPTGSQGDASLEEPADVHSKDLKV